MTKQVKCVVGVSQINITKDKIYDVIEENYVCYKITDDSAKNGYFNKGYFEEYEPRKFVKLVNNYYNRPNITINKIYEVVKEHSYSYSIVNDNGLELLYSKDMFEESSFPNTDNNIKKGKFEKVEKCDHLSIVPKYKFIPESEIIEVVVDGTKGILIKE